MTSDSFRGGRYIPVLDGLRGIAVLMVMLCHVPQTLWHWRLWPALDFLKPAHLGVDVFFVLSGFLITRILLADRAAGTPLRYFLARRALRIFPIYYLLLGVIALTGASAATPIAAAYLSNFHFALDPSADPLRHTWSLAVEEHFYLLWPLAVMGLSVAASRRVAWLIVPGGVAAACVIAATWEPGVGRDLIYRATFTRMASLGLGALLAYHETTIRGYARRSSIASCVAVLAGVGLLAIGRNMAAIAWGAVVTQAAYCLISGGAVVAVICAGGVVRRLFTAPPLRYVGRISYGLYLYHFPIFYALDLHRTYDPAVQRPVALLAIAVSFAVSAASWHVFEARVMRLKRHFQHAPPAEAPAVAGVITPRRAAA